MIRKILFIVLGLLVIIPSSLHGEEKRGIELITTKKDGLSVSGELIAVKQDALLLLSEKGADVSVGIDDIRKITNVKKSKLLLGAGIGFLAVAAYTVYDISDEGAASKGYITYPLIFGSIGALVGATIGEALSKDKTIQIEGKSETEVAKILDDLRKKARIPDFQ